MPLEITPEPDEAERKAILAALAADIGEQPAASAWAAALLPGRNDEEPAVTVPGRPAFSQHVGGMHPL